MGRTILEIAKEAAERDNTTQPPVSLFTGTERVSRLLRIALKDTMREYLRDSTVVGTSEFEATHVFTLEPGKYAYPLPPDYLRMIPGTEHRGTWPLGLIGPVSPRVWANWIAGAAASPAAMTWRIANNAIWVTPGPDRREIVQISYISRYPVVAPVTTDMLTTSGSTLNVTAPFVPRDGALGDKVSEALFAEEYDGTAYGDVPGWDEAVWVEEVNEVLARLNLTSAVAPYPQVRKAEFEADTDRPAFEDDHVLSLGLTFRLRRAMGLPYAEHAAEYEAEANAKRVADAGGARDTILTCRKSRIETYPLGDGRWLVT